MLYWNKKSQIDALPTAYHAVVKAKVQPGSTVYIAGFGPVGACAAACATQLFGAIPIVGKVNKERLERGKLMNLFFQILIFIGFKSKN